MNLPAELDRRPVRWSYTFLNLYEDICPHQAYRKYILRDIPYVESPAAKKGNDIHTALEHRVGGGKPLPPEMEAYEKFAVAFDGRKTAVEKKLGVTITGKATGFFDQDCWGRGKADLTLVNGKVGYILDWKRGRMRDNPFELEVQAMFLKCKYPTLQKIVGSYVWLKEDRIGQLHDLSDFRRTAEEIQQLVMLIERDKEAEKFEKRPGGLCSRWCEVTTCEHNGRYEPAK